MMNAQWRLDSKAPGVAAAFRNATPEKRRRATLTACETVVPIVDLEGDDVTAALDALRCGEPADPRLQEQLSALAARFDDEYFRLNEEGGEAKHQEALHLFAKARAASALAFALTDNDAQLHEALHEALSSVFASPGRVARAMEMALPRGAAPSLQSDWYYISAVSEEMPTRKIPVRAWNFALHGPITLGAVRALHEPQRRHRVSLYRYPASTRFAGAMRAGTCYVVTGSCRYRFAETVELRLGQIACLPEGAYELEVTAADELIIILAWRLPFEIP